MDYESRSFDAGKTTPPSCRTCRMLGDCQTWRFLWSFYRKTLILSFLMEASGTLSGCSLRRLSVEAGCEAWVSADAELNGILCRYIDEGGNPDSYTAEIFNRANRANQYSKGKGEALEAFRFGLTLLQTPSSLKGSCLAEAPAHASQTWIQLTLTAFFKMDFYEIRAWYFCIQYWSQ